MNQEEMLAGKDREETTPAAAGDSPEVMECPDEAGEPETTAVEDEIARLRAELDVERRERQAAEDRALRFRADFENLRRRTALEAEQLRTGLIQDLVGRFLPVLDDLERALQAAGQEAAPSWLSGVEMVRRRFLAALGELGLARMETVGRPFDPERHEAMLRVEDSGLASGTVVEELRPGYLLGDRVIRPALVKVQV